jgi:hypothetical protein
MSLGIVLDVAIGLAFTYLLLAIMVSGLLEVFAGYMSLRGKGLRDGLKSLLAGLTRSGGHDDSLFRSVFDHALVSRISKDGLPAYVPARNFSLALFDALQDGSHGTAFSRIEQGVAALPEGPAKQALATFVADAGGNLDTLRTRVETWFDDGMDRLSGVYKRFSLYFMMAVSLVVAVALNVDSINLARTLWTQPNVRAALVSAAQEYESAQRAAPQTPPGQGAVDPNQAADARKRSREAQCLLATLPLPIGWSDQKSVVEACKAGKEVDQLSSLDLKAASRMFRDRVFAGDWSGVWLVVGWIITALAVSLGAPFWFSALQQLLSLRNAGPKPPRSDQAPQGGNP